MIKKETSPTEDVLWGFDAQGKPANGWKLWKESDSHNAFDKKNLGRYASQYQEERKVAV